MKKLMSVSILAAALASGVAIAKELPVETVGAMEPASGAAAQMRDNSEGERAATRALFDDVRRWADPSSVPRPQGEDIPREVTYNLGAEGARMTNGQLNAALRQVVTTSVNPNVSADGYGWTVGSSNEVPGFSLDLAYKGKPPVVRYWVSLSGRILTFVLK